MRKFARITKLKEKLYNLKEKIIFAMFMAQTIMYSTPAYADTTADGLFTPSSGDVSVQMLGKLFGGLVGSGADPLKDLITTFNGAVLSVGGLLVAYTIFAGTIGTAHEGEMLGRKFSSVWVPLRTAMGTALVVPINGYCTMQMIVMWLIMQGIGLADTVWSSLVQGDALQSSVALTASQNSPEFRQLATNVLKAAICLDAAQKNSDYITNKGQSWTSYDMGRYIYFGENGSVLNSSSCGNILLLNTTADSTVQTSNTFATSAIEDIRAKSDLAVRKAHNDAVHTMVETAKGVAGNFVSVKTESGANSLLFNKTANADVIESMASAYGNTMFTAVNNYYAQTTDIASGIKSNASQDGWIMAGAWFNKIANQLTKVNTALTTVPTVSPSDHIMGIYYDDVNKVLKQVDPALANNSKDLANGVAKQNTDDKAGGSTFTRFLATFVTGVDLKEIAQQTNVHPIVQMKQMGDKLIRGAIVSIVSTIGLAAVIAGGATNFFTEKTGAGGAALAAILFIAPIAFLIFGSLLTLGFFLSYYIPMIPFLIWMGCIIGWFIMVLEAVIAAPLWAVMHLHPNGDDVVGRGGSGYMLVLGLLVRPTLMICGLASSIILSMVLGTFINSIFFDVFTMSREGDGIGFFATILGYVLYTTMMVTFIHKMFSVIHVIPDQLLRWIGGGGEQLGQYAGALVQGTEGQFMKAGGVMGTLGSQGMTVGTTALQRAQQRALQGAQKDNDNQIAARNEASSGARSLGMSMDQAEALGAFAGDSSNTNSKDSASLRSMKNAASATGQMTAAVSQLQASGASGAEVAKFQASVQSMASDFAESDSKAGGGAPATSPLTRAIESAQNDHFDDKFGAGAGAAIMGAATVTQKHQDGTPKTNPDGSPQTSIDGARQATASSKIASASNKLSDSGFKNMMSDISSATTGQMSNLSPAVQQSLSNYESGHGLKFDSNSTGENQPASNYAAAINAISKHYLEDPSSQRQQTVRPGPQPPEGNEGNPSE